MHTHDTQPCKRRRSNASSSNLEYLRTPNIYWSVWRKFCDYHRQMIKLSWPKQFMLFLCNTSYIVAVHAKPRKWQNCQKSLFCVNLMLKLLYISCKNITIFFKVEMCFYRYFKTSHVIGVWNSPCKTSHLPRMLPHTTAVAAKPRISGSMVYPAARRSN